MEDLMHNFEGYLDKTGGIAVKNVSKEEKNRMENQNNRVKTETYRNENEGMTASEEKKLRDFMTIIFRVCDVCGYHLEERVVLRDIKTGRIYR